MSDPWNLRNQRFEVFLAWQGRADSMYNGSLWNANREVPMRQLMTSRAWWLLACIPAIWGTVWLLVALLDEHTAEPSFWLGVPSLFALAILFGIKAVIMRL